MLRRTIAALGAFTLACLAAEQKLGKPFTLQAPTPIADILKSPGQYVDKTIQVKGRMSEVCEMAGCWTNLVDPATNQMIRIKVNDGDIVFPKEAIGKMTIAEGTLKRFELTREQAVARAKHEAEEQGRKFNPATVKSGTTVYQIQGAGAIIID